MTSVRWLLTLLMALALAFLPASGASRAEAAQPACHEQMPDDDAGAACAEHCMTQVAAAQPSPSLQPSVANVIGAERAVFVDRRAPRAPEAPDTPPPRR